MGLEFGFLIMPTPRPGNSIEQMLATNELLLRSCAERNLTAWFVDHFQFGDRPYLECLAQLAHSAGRFPGLRLGTLVLGQGYRNPALIAKSAATLQFLTGGKLILGIGAGWKEDEYIAYGYDFPSAAERLEQLHEAARIITTLWRESEVTFTGKHYRVAGAICAPRPDPKPVLMIGGGGEKRTLRIAAEHADWWNVDYIGPDDFARKLCILRQHCEAIGRDPDTIVPTYFGMVSLARDPAKVQRTPPSNYPAHAVPIAGDPDQVTKTLRVFERIGARHIQLVFLDYPQTEGIELFLEEVLPRFEAAA